MAEGLGIAIDLTMTEARRNSCQVGVVWWSMMVGPEGGGVVGC